MEHIAQGKRSDTLGLPHSRVSAPCKGKSFNPLCCYFYLIADLAALKRNIVCIFCSTPAPCPIAFALTGRDCSNTRHPGCRFACPGLWAPLGFHCIIGCGSAIQASLIAFALHDDSAALAKSGTREILSYNNVIVIIYIPHKLSFQSRQIEVHISL